MCEFLFVILLKSTMQVINNVYCFYTLIYLVVGIACMVTNDYSIKIKMLGYETDKELHKYYTEISKFEDKSHQLLDDIKKTTNKFKKSSNIKASKALDYLKYVEEEMEDIDIEHCNRDFLFIHVIRRQAYGVALLEFRAGIWEQVNKTFQTLVKHFRASQRRVIELKQVLLKCGNKDDCLEDCWVKLTDELDVIISGTAEVTRLDKINWYATFLNQWIDFETKQFNKFVGDTDSDMDVFQECVELQFLEFAVKSVKGEL